MFLKFLQKTFLPNSKEFDKKRHRGGVVLKLALGNYIINEKHEKVGYKPLTNRKMLDANFINMEEDYN